MCNYKGTVEGGVSKFICFEDLEEAQWDLV
jgi:hypothetical protein